MRSDEAIAAFDAFFCAPEELTGSNPIQPQLNSMGLTY